MHPLLVHLPIGFIILAIFIDWYQSRKGLGGNFDISLFVWGLTALSSIAAVITGLVLVNSGHYEGLEVFIHRWTAIGIAVITSLIFITKWTHKVFFNKQDVTLKVLTIILLVVAGHKGGEITHGADFLPLPFVGPKVESTPTLAGRDSIQLYIDIIAPIIETKCVRCHEEGDERGRLNLQTKEGLFSDIFGDPGISPGNLEDSEIFKRVTLAPNHEKFMPPSGPPFTYPEIRVLEYWITSGASFTDKLHAESEIPSDIKWLLRDAYQIDFSEKSIYEKLDVAPASKEDIAAVRNASFSVRQIAAGLSFLDVSRVGFDEEVTNEQMQQLLLIKDQITWLDLAGTSVSDDIGSIIAQMPNLTKLKLQNTKVGDALVQQISSLQHLQVLNLYNTQLTDEGLREIRKMSSLESLFIWQTEVSDSLVEELQTELPDLDIVRGTI